MLTRRFTIIAQDPTVKNADGKILTTQVRVPTEELDQGPRGYRVHVVDYDSSQRVLYKPFKPDHTDAFANASDNELLTNPAFHAQNVYAVVMRLLNRFEASLGRRISWGFNGHQIHIVPHAFADANAFYSEDARGLYFGYFPGSNGKRVFTCLSHDIITHEATHALLDGLRESYTLPSHPDQAGFHEAYADVIALLSVFGLRDVVKTLLPKTNSDGVTKKDGNYIKKSDLESDKLKDNILLGLANQFGQETSRHRKDCLRRAVKRPPRKNAKDDLDFQQAHLRGEILSAAVLNSFIAVWMSRLKSWLPKLDETVPIARVIEDAGDAADHLLNICIRALDYCPVVDITFSDFLSAMLTADYELVPDDGKYNYRQTLRDQFKAWGITPGAHPKADSLAPTPPEPGAWHHPADKDSFNYGCVHRESLERDENEVFRFLWENRKKLGIPDQAYTWIISLRPCLRVAPDGFFLRETVAEYRQTMEADAGDLEGIYPGLKKPEGMPIDTKVRLNGGGVLIFDEFGHLKYHISSRIDNYERQNKRLEYLWKNGIRDRDDGYGFTMGTPKGQRFAMMHLRRDGIIDKEEWPHVKKSKRQSTRQSEQQSEQESE